MKLQYLGTGAAEGIPAIFCDCETCRTARERGGRKIHLASFDCTFGAKDTDDHGHMTLSRCAAEKRRFVE